MSNPNTVSGRFFKIGEWKITPEGPGKKVIVLNISPTSSKVDTFIKKNW